MNGLTFNQMTGQAQEMSGDSSSTTLVYFKRWINQANITLLSELKRYWTQIEQTASTVADQQYYQMPNDCIRPTSIVITIAGRGYVLEEIEDDTDWLVMNEETTQTSAIPTHYYVKGKDQFGIWPIPSGSTSNAIKLVYEPAEKFMTQDDFSTGTVTVTNGSATITHSATGFTQNMVGRFFQTTDNSDGTWLKVVTFNSTSSLTLENVYEGIGGAGKTFLIGEMSTLPGELHDSLVDFCLHKYYLRNKDSAAAAEFKSLWTDVVSMAKSRYSSKSTSQVIPAHSMYSGRYSYKNATRDYLVTGS